MLEKIFKNPWSQSSTSQQKAQKAQSQSKFSIDWVIPGQIAIGPLPKQHNIDLFQQYGIRSIISLSSAAEGIPPESLLADCYWEQHPLPDSHWNEPLTPEALSHAVKRLHFLKQQFSPVYIHCVAGIERSPTVCLAYLCCYNGLKIWEGLCYLKQIHPATAPTPEQLKVVQSLIELTLLAFP